MFSSVSERLGFSARKVASLLSAFFWVASFSSYANEFSNPTELSEHEPKNRQVGEATLVLGRAFIYHSDGSSKQLETGDSIQELDRITTRSNGHAHIHFLDDAYVSVRPNSELEITQYKYDESSPEDSVVRFDLKEGITRSISGKAARAARERYRMNTPVAAIGVRGTDYVVNANASSIKAKVFEGAIVLAPYSESCSKESLGPCMANAIQLDPQSSQLLALEVGGPQSQLQTDPGAGGSEDPERNDLQIASSAGNESGSGSSSQAADESDVAQQNEAVLEIKTNAAVSSEANAVASASSEDKVDEPPVADVPQLVDFTPAFALTADDVESRQLVWGRYSFAGPPTEYDPIALSYSDASKGRDTSVGDLTYGLMRTPATPAIVDRNLGVVGFQLSVAQAVFNSGTGVALMKVGGGSLEINFIESLFSTELNLAHEMTGQIDITGSGRIFDGGFFRAIDETQKISGAVSYDGAEAGYLFEKQISQGTVSGLTLWDSK